MPPALYWVGGIRLLRTEVTKLASSRGSSNGVDWRDVATQWLAFEEMNRVQLSMRMSSAGEHVSPDLFLALEAHPVGVKIGEAPSLASSSVRVSALNVRTMEAALSYALYQIDFLLAAQEIDPRAKP